jgi:hypothetical protein
MGWGMKGPRVTLEQWRTLQAVVDGGGFAQAAYQDRLIKTARQAEHTEQSAG